MAGAWWWGEDAMSNMYERCWCWWRRHRDRAAESAGHGPRAGDADLAGERGYGHALWVRPAGGAGASGDWGGSTEWALVCFSFAKRRPVENFFLGLRVI